QLRPFRSFVGGWMHQVIETCGPNQTRSQVRGIRRRARGRRARIKENYQMATVRQETKTISTASQPDESVREPGTKRKRPDGGRFHLQVYGQTKESYATYEAAETAGMAIKKDYPILQVAVYDGVDGMSKIIELPKVANP